MKCHTLEESLNILESSPDHVSVSSFPIHTTPSPSASSHGLLGRWLYSEMCPLATDKDSASSIAPQWTGLKACCWMVGWRGCPPIHVPGHP